MSGFIQKYRTPFRELMRKFPRNLRIRAWAFWDEALMRANWEPGFIDGEPLERGQFVFGREEMAEVLGISEREFRTIRDRFLKVSELTVESSNRGTIATIVNFDIYVRNISQTDQQSDQQSGQQTTSKRPANDHSVEPNSLITKEYKEKNGRIEDLYIQRRNQV